MRLEGGWYCGAVRYVASVAVTSTRRRQPRNTRRKVSRTSASGNRGAKESEPFCERRPWRSEGAPGFTPFRSLRGPPLRCLQLFDHR